MSQSQGEMIPFNQGICNTRKRYLSHFKILYFSINLLTTHYFVSYYPLTDAFSWGISPCLRKHQQNFVKSKDSLQEQYRNDENTRALRLAILPTWRKTRSSSSISARKGESPPPPQDFFGSSDDEEEGEFYDAFAEDDSAALNENNALLFGDDFIEGSEEDYDLYDEEEETQLNKNEGIRIPVQSSLYKKDVIQSPTRRNPSWDTSIRQEMNSVNDDDGETNADVSKYVLRLEEEDDDQDTEDGYLEDDSPDIPVQDDVMDPNYMSRKNEIEKSIQDRDIINDLRNTLSRSEESPEFLQRTMAEFLDEELIRAGIDPKLVEENLEKLKIDEKNDIPEILDRLKAEAAKASTMSSSQNTLAFLRNLGSDSDAFPSDDDPILADRVDPDDIGQNTTAIHNADLLQLQKALEDLVGTIDGYDTGRLIDNKQAMIQPYYELERLDPKTVDEIYLCLNASAVDEEGDEYDEEVKSDDPLRILLYDLNFNISNVMLAAFKHNPEAPIIMNHWMPQLVTYSRYAHMRERKFQFTWEDVDAANVDELHRYYQGLGHSEIPTKTPKETNLVELETDHDPEDIYMSAFENWIEEVYQEEDENTYFDDEDFQPEQNVYDPNYGLEDSDHIKGFMSELREFEADFANETQAFRDTYVTETNYTHVIDEEATREFRGHLIIACCASDKDLDLAEKITLRMEKEFGKKIYVETRVYNHARQEDNLYEIWLESYDIELIHSRRGAIYNKRKWDGKADVDDEQLDYIVGKVGHMISDDTRYSYWLHEFYTEV